MYLHLLDFVALYSCLLLCGTLTSPTFPLSAPVLQRSYIPIRMSLYSRVSLPPLHCVLVSVPMSQHLRPVHNWHHKSPTVLLSPNMPGDSNHTATHRHTRVPHIEEARQKQWSSTPKKLYCNTCAERMTQYCHAIVVLICACRLYYLYSLLIIPGYEGVPRGVHC